jgi:hypothetical protein
MAIAAASDRVAFGLTLPVRGGVQRMDVTIRRLPFGSVSRGDFEGIYLSEGGGRREAAALVSAYTRLSSAASPSPASNAASLGNCGD